jgi:hypothetical protein
VITSTKRYRSQRWSTSFTNFRKQLSCREPLREFIAKNPVDADSLSHYLNWDRQHYTRNLIDRTQLYELIAIRWEVGHASSVHNYRD